MIPDVSSAALFDADVGKGHIPRILPDTNGYITLPETYLLILIKNLKLGQMEQTLF